MSSGNSHDEHAAAIEREKRLHPLRIVTPEGSRPASEPMFAEDIDGVWHARRDDFWDNDASANIRAHAACGADIWSCHVSAYPPVLGDAKARHCRGCFPLGRKPRGR